MKIDFSNMLETSIGKHGLSNKEIDMMMSKMTDVHQGMEDKKEDMVWRTLPYKQEALIPLLEKEAKRINDNFDNFVVFGIGGSALGAKALFSGTKHLRYNELSKEKRGGARFYVLDNVDPDGINALLDVIDVKKTCFNVITKSGNTVETMSQFMVALGELEKAVGADKLQDHIILTTDKELGILRDIADTHNFTSYIVPEGVGGRFSVLSPVGLLAAAVLNIDINELMDGAKAMDALCTQEDVWENPAYMYALLMVLAMAKKANMSVMMPYADGLDDMAEWYAQLWAESLGKMKNNDGETVYCGQTPVRALGVTDQHSQIQLYTEGPFDKVITFIDVEKFRTTLDIPKTTINMIDASYLEGQTFNKLIDAEMQATEYAVTQAGKMNMRIMLEEMTPYTISQLFYFFEMATAAAGELLEINAFDQPGVEAGKIATFALMGREGYEEQAEELTQGTDKQEKFIYDM